MIYVLIPVHNRIEKTMRCLQSVYRQNRHDIKVVIVDDGSTDATKSSIKSKFPETVILNGTGSLFWTGAVHYGINYISSMASKDDWVVLINNDVVLREDVIDKLVLFSESKDRNVIVNALSVDLEDKNTIIKSGTRLKSWLFNITEHMYHGEKVTELASADAVEVDLLTGRCLLHPFEVFWIAGNYDAKLLPHYGGDDEFTARVKLIGYELYVLPSAIVYLDNNQAKMEKSFFNALFDVRSNINIINKWHFARSVVPFYAFPTYYLVAVLKSFFVFLRNK